MSTELPDHHLNPSMRYWFDPFPATTIREAPGPSRVVTDQPGEVTRHPLGFAPSRSTTQAEPLLWEGDGA